MTKWTKTSYPGVRDSEHKTRKHGSVMKDRYHTIRHKIAGKDREEGLGWSSEDWTAEKAAGVLAELKKAATLGEGPKTLAEKRMVDREKREREQAEHERREKESVTFDQFYKDTYLPRAKADKKATSVDLQK
jgi:hypothetical protein